MAFTFAWAMGANDVPNAFASVITSGVLSFKGAVVVSSVFELLGALLMGEKVTSTIVQNVVDWTKLGDKMNGPSLTMWGLTCALGASSVWVTIATFYAWPISSTHTIIGAMVAHALVMKAGESIYWVKKTAKGGTWEGLPISPVVGIAVSWVASPVLAATLAGAFFGLIKRFILVHDDSVERTLNFLPFTSGLTALVITLLVMFSSTSWLKKVDVLMALGIAFAAALAGCLLGYVVGIPLARERLRRYDSLLRRQLEADAEAPPPAMAAVPPATEIDGRGGNPIDGLPAGLRLEGEEVDGVGDGRGDRGDDDAGRGDGNARIVPWGFGGQIVFDEHTLRLHALSRRFKRRTEELFKIFQVFAGCAMAFAHGANDVGNPIAPFAVIYAIHREGEVFFQSDFKAPLQIWMLVLGGVGICVGFAVWGWRVATSIGGGLTLMTPSRGFSCLLTSSFVVAVASRLGLPISTTQVLVGSTVGVGAADNFRTVDWCLFGKFLLSWLVTAAVAGGMTALFFAISVYSPIQP
ncbi:hypothetical protein CBR_g48724 [Chara braunii]|uniref:Phosphate transporter n=1 Tax=Chara braunii TaxID=69332 RepID=A0A388K4K3_CHABU|nr:hypothetical protein CBR_g48724 [Chara braunii]|eukprot:GBG64975.1 hypothetical protein CBR_g48724 [Chara braunii]